MHVLFVPSWYPTDRSPASGVFFRDQALALAHCGYEVGVVFPEHESIRARRLSTLAAHRWQIVSRYEHGIATIRRMGWNVRPLWLSRKLWIRSAVRLAQEYVRRYGPPDVIHAQSAVWAAAAAAKIADALDKPFVVTEHRSNFMDRSWRPVGCRQTRAALRAAQGVAAVSSSLSRAVEAFEPAVECQVIPNVVDTTHFFPSAERRDPDAPFTIVSVGRLSHIKGMDVLIRAFARAFPRDSDVRLVIAGDGPERPLLESLCVDLEIHDRVELVGHVPREQLPTFLRRADLFALASRTETFGVAIIEALASGVPVVATRAGGPSDIVTTDVGWLADPDDVDGFAEALASARRCAPRFDARRLSAIANERFGRTGFVERLRTFYARAAA